MAAVMDVVVPCDCGTKFSFSVEPVEGRLPEGAELSCPGCGKDGVPLANRVIGDDLRKQQREQERKEREAAAQQPKKSGWLNKKKETPPPPDPYAYPAEAHDPFANARNKEDDSVYSGPNRLRGIIGALLGGLIGATIWAASVYFTGYEIKYVAVGVGVLSGWGSRILGGGRDYHLGLFASACAFVAILVGVYFGAKLYTEKTISFEVATFEYEMRLDRAKEAADLKTLQEYKEFIAATQSTLYKPIDPSSITPKQVLEFQTTELPQLKKFANGEPSRDEFIKQERNAFLAKQTVKDYFIIGITPYLFFWVFLGVGAAWKLASDYGTSVE